MQRLPCVRRLYTMELLERRHFLSIVPIDAMAGVPFEGLLATELRLPAHATGLDAVHVFIVGQWDYSPTAVVRADGTFDLYTRMIPQRSGTGETTIWFRNNLTGGWDILERGEQTIRPNHFDARVADHHFYDLLPGTRMRQALATFATTALTRALDEYVVEVQWFGQIRAGRLVAEPDGSVGAYVDDAYLPLDEDGEVTVTVTIRPAGASDEAPAAGFARVLVSAGSYGIGIGSFDGAMSSDSEFRINLPRTPKHPGLRSGYFAPAGELEGWESTFTAALTWHYRDRDVATTTATVVRNDDGTHAIVGRVPEGVRFDSAMMKIHETVRRPAMDGVPAHTYGIEYVGSFQLAGRQPPPGGQDADVPIEPDPAIPGSRWPVQLRAESEFAAIAIREMGAAGSRGFSSIMTALFAGDDDDLLIGDTAGETADPSLPA